MAADGARDDAVGVPAVIVGSAVQPTLLRSLTGLRLSKLPTVSTPFGDCADVFRADSSGSDVDKRATGRPLGYVLFRHGCLPDRHLLPHQINWRANAFALAELGVTHVMLTSSVGVLDSGTCGAAATPRLPLFHPLALTDLAMVFGNRLPDGSPCTLFHTAALQPSRDRPAALEAQGHLVFGGDGVFSAPLTDRLVAAATESRIPITQPDGGCVFGYVPGPRTKTPAENRWLARCGVCDVNSMTLGPEAILLSELGLPVTGVVVGHKASSGSSAAASKQATEDRSPIEEPAGSPAATQGGDRSQDWIGRSLADSRPAMAGIVAAFLRLQLPREEAAACCRHSLYGFAAGDSGLSRGGAAQRAALWAAARAGKVRS